MPVKNKISTLLVIVLSFSLIMGISNFIVTIFSATTPNVPYYYGDRWTFVSEPLPVWINETQIPVGSDWTYVYTLKESSLYHVYFYGNWIGTRTDYDIFMYDPFGNLESSHTEASGLPEHLGTTVDEPYFIPEYSGQYSFLIKNDLKESNDNSSGTLFLIEHLESNKWYTHYLQGKVNEKPVELTSWAYEFVTSSRHIEVLIEVPDTLDMFEARLYLMGNEEIPMGNLNMSQYLNGIPLPWEPGLWGNMSGSYGGYNLESEGWTFPEGVASCEYAGQDMLINYSTTYSVESLYHLGLIAEYGSGNIRFMFKTDFAPPQIEILNSTENVDSYTDSIISASIFDDISTIKNVQLSYTTDNWESSSYLTMLLKEDDIFECTIPGQSEGTIVQYKIMATDNAGNMGEMEGQYNVKKVTSINCNISHEEIELGNVININGVASPSNENITVRLMLSTPEGLMEEETVYAGSDGNYAFYFQPDLIGYWHVQAIIDGNELYKPSVSMSKSFNVTAEATGFNFTYVYVILGIMVPVVAVFIYKRRKNSGEMDFSKLEM